MELSVQVEKPSNITRKLTIKVPATEVANWLQKGLVEVQKTAKLKGFRPGHVPLSVVKQYYGSDVKHRVYHNLIDASFKQAVQKEAIKAVGRPKIETESSKDEHDHSKHTLDEDKDLTFTATVEVLPEVEVKGYTGISLTKEKVDVTDKDVDTIVEQLRNAHAELVPASSALAGADGSQASRPAKKGDFVDLKFEGGVVTDEGLDARPGMSGQRMIEIGSNQLIAGFEDNLIGMTTGETKTFRLTFPKDYFEEDLREKQAEFTVTAGEIKEKKLPELTDEFAQDAGYESVLDMRTKARAHLSSEKTQESERKLKSDLLQELISKNDFEIPESLVQAQTRALAQDVAQNLKQQGFNDEMVQEALMSELENLKKRAESQVRASLILESIAKKENITVSAEDVKTELETMAKNMNLELDKIREFYEQNPSRKEDLEFRLREDRTVKHILEKSKIKEK